MKSAYTPLLLILTAVFFLFPARAEVVFSSGFEEGNKDIWDDWDGNPDSTNLIMEDPGPAGVEGNHVMRLRVPPGRGGADIVKVLPGSYDRLFLRWYQQWEPGYDFGAPCHGGGLHAGDRSLLGRSDYRPQGDDWFCAWLEPMNGRLNFYSYYRGMYQDCADPNGSCWGDHFPCTMDEGSNYCTKAEHRETLMPPQLETGRWYCLEMMVEAGDPVSDEQSANGVQTFWIDEVEYGPWEGLWHRTTADLKLSILWLSLFHHEEHSMEGILLDDIVVADERIGPLSNVPATNHRRRAGGSASILIRSPVPVRGRLHYEIGGTAPAAIRMDVLNLLGQVIVTSGVMNTGGKKRFSLDVTGLMPGMYVLLLSQCGRQVSERFALYILN